MTEGFYQYFVIIVTIQATSVVIVGEHVPLFVEQFVTEIAIPDFAQYRTGYFPAFEPEDLVGSLFFKVLGIQVGVDDPAQVHSDVNISLFDGKGVGKIPEEVALGVIVNGFLNIRFFSMKQ